MFLCICSDIHGRNRATVKYPAVLTLGVTFLQAYNMAMFRRLRLRFLVALSRRLTLSVRCWRDDYTFASNAEGKRWGVFERSKCGSLGILGSLKVWLGTFRAYCFGHGRNEVWNGLKWFLFQKCRGSGCDDVRRFCAQENVEESSS